MQDETPWKLLCCLLEWWESHSCCLRKSLSLGSSLHPPFFFFCVSGLPSKTNAWLSKGGAVTNHDYFHLSSVEFSLMYTDLLVHSTCGTKSGNKGWSDAIHCCSCLVVDTANSLSPGHQWGPGYDCYTGWFSGKESGETQPVFIYSFQICMIRPKPSIFKLLNEDLNLKLWT